MCPLLHGVASISPTQADTLVNDERLCHMQHRYLPAFQALAQQITGSILLCCFTWRFPAGLPAQLAGQEYPGTVG